MNGNALMSDLKTSIVFQVYFPRFQSTTAINPLIVVKVRFTIDYWNKKDGWYTQESWLFFSESFVIKFQKSAYVLIFTIFKNRPNLES